MQSRSRFTFTARRMAPTRWRSIFEYPKAEHNSVNPKIGLCLECFATGERAKRAFAGNESEEEGGEPGAEEGSQPVTF